MSEIKQPATPQEAEILAIQAVQDYIAKCNAPNQEMIGNYLMKLCSVAGFVMANCEGSKNAANRLIGTAEFVRKNGSKNPKKLVPVQ